MWSIVLQPTNYSGNLVCIARNCDAEVADLRLTKTDARHHILSPANFCENSQPFNCCIERRSGEESGGRHGGEAARRGDLQRFQSVKDHSDKMVPARLDGCFSFANALNLWFRIWHSLHGYYSKLPTRPKVTRWWSPTPGLRLPSNITVPSGTPDMRLLFKTILPRGTLRLRLLRSTVRSTNLEADNRMKPSKVEAV
ncbi:uncharacterized protein MYCFIDRAFT_180361 [Pseudocercospora fijiensis CIRAD86]|uniref:Uncharacterized protein n=1 Tax=Pseudocercospora fijiensis (strain CIRAD86) TaxID=383855 RepID=M2YGT9_PSEFD|nr:uncharacterized protein MYCFIDRAFT_180361 [Pseudocercospora fijiensis CIRAD86]EME77030.1 hypothetical protein MYCFIDRAFT_180361 [Pseudocercospora fijiensis CIRAD86]